MGDPEVICREQLGRIGVLQWATVSCSESHRCVALCCSELQGSIGKLSHSHRVSRSQTLEQGWQRWRRVCHELYQYTVTHCNTPERTGTHLWVIRRSSRTFKLKHAGENCSGAYATRTVSYCNTLQNAATRCNTLQHTAARHNTLQRTATHLCVLRFSFCKFELYHAADGSSGALVAARMSRSASLCNMLQHTVTHCNIQQHIATHLWVICHSSCAFKL